MADIAFRVAERTDYGELADWLARVSQAPERHCLHTWSGQTAKELQSQLLSYRDASELCYVVAVREGRLVGAMGSEYDQELERGWLHGPHATSEDWESIAMELFKALSAELPACIRQLQAYLNVENVRGRHFYALHGFKESSHVNYDFWLAHDARVVVGDRGCAFLRREHEASFKQLFAALFPAAYYTAERIVDMIGQTHQVLVAEEANEVLGFVVASVEQGPSAGEIQFLGVRQECRRRGHGRRLLLSAVDWLLDEAGTRAVCLNVGEDLVHARALYESVGFVLRFTGVGLHRATVE